MAKRAKHCLINPSFGPKTANWNKFQVEKVLPWHTWRSLIKLFQCRICPVLECPRCCRMRPGEPLEKGTMANCWWHLCGRALIMGPKWWGETFPTVVSWAAICMDLGGIACRFAWRRRTQQSPRVFRGGRWRANMDKIYLGGSRKSTNNCMLCLLKPSNDRQ